MIHPIASHPSDQQTLDELKAVATYLSENSLVMTTAESCTAGLIAAHLADVRGAGKCLDWASNIESGVAIAC